jgi:hypothetical protein
VQQQHQNQAPPGKALESFHRTHTVSLHWCHSTQTTTNNNNRSTQASGCLYMLSDGETVPELTHTQALNAGSQQHSQ